MNSVSGISLEVLRAGLDDWVPLAAVEGIARRHGVGAGDDLREVCVEAIRKLAEEGLVEIGEVSDGGFFEWEETLDEAVERINTLWENTGPNTWGFAVWISNTPVGAEIAARIPTDGTEV